MKMGAVAGLTLFNVHDMAICLPRAENASGFVLSSEAPHLPTHPS